MKTVIKFLAGLIFFLVVNVGFRALVGAGDLMLVASWQAIAFYLGFRLALVK